MDFLTDEFLQKYPNIKKFLESRRNSQKKVAEMFGIEEKKLFDLAESHPEHMTYVRVLVLENNSVNGKKYLDYALELHRNFEKEKLKNGLSN